MRKLFVLTAFLMLTGSLYAQSSHHCATDSLWKSDPAYSSYKTAFAYELMKFRNQTPSAFSFISSGDTGSELQAITLGCQEVIYIVPLVVHIDTSGGTVNVSDTQVMQQVQILNDAFFPHGIRFVLAQRRPNGDPFSGINRFGGTFDYRYTHLAQSYAGTAFYYDPARYANLYIAPHILTSSGGASNINGFNQRRPDYPSTAPSPDLMVVRHTKFGDFTSCTSCGVLDSSSRGIITLHEAGHFLGLYELWEGGCSEGNTANTCSIEGDLCCDTRPVNANYTCLVPGGNDCGYHLAISDNHENYMDYTPDPCQDNFTPNQESLMRSSLELYRKTLISPQNLNQLGLNDCFASAWFDSEQDFFCDSGTFSLSAIFYDSALTYRWIISNGGTIILDSTLNSNELSWFCNQVANYTVRLDIIFNNNDTARVTRFGYLRVANCGITLASEQGNWFFGDNAGLRFTQQGGAIRDLGPFLNQFPTNINTTEGTISHSDAAGNLLFYGGGSQNAGQFEVYNRNYLPMPSSPIIGDYSACQTGAVVPVPGQMNQYYLFTLGGNDAGDSSGFRYSIIDMTLNFGNGDIDPIVRNVPILGPVGSQKTGFDSTLKCGEAITVIPACQAGEYWILVLDNSDSIYTNSSKILVYHLDTSGLSFHAISQVKLEETELSSMFYTDLKASPDGSWVFVGGKLSTFNKGTGDLLLYRDLSSGLRQRAASFSALSKILYLVEEEFASAKTAKVIQFNLASSNDSLDKTLVSTYPYENVYVTIQLGPDSSIYLSKDGQSSLAVIASPDERNSLTSPNACQYSFNGPVLSSNGIGGRSAIGLPNMMDARATALVVPDFLVVDSACGTLFFYPNTKCAASYLWSFGDGDTSILENPQHEYIDTGLYTITLSLNGTPVASKTYYKGNTSKIGGSPVACVLDSGLAFYSISNMDPYSFYSWSIINGTEAFLDQSQNIGVEWNGSGAIVLNRINPANGCTYSDTLQVEYASLGSNTISLSDATCFPGADLEIGGSEALINGSSAQTKYQWESRTLAGSWQELTADTTRHFTGFVPAEPTYFRRKVYNLSCAVFSDSILVEADIIINSMTAPFSECAESPSKTRTFSFSIDTKDSSWYLVKLYSYEFSEDIQQFEFKHVATSGVVYQPVNINYTWEYSEAFFFEIVTSCGNYHSDTIAVYECFEATSYGGWTHPTSTVSLNAGDTLEIVAYYEYCRPDAPPHDGEWYSWQYSGDTTNWNEIETHGWYNLDTTLGSDTLRLIVDRCMNGGFFRRQHYNPCATFTVYKYSNRTTVNIANINDFNLWARDGAADTADEPNSDPNNDFWNSPDLWNCRTSSSCSTHQSPEYMTSGFNYVRNTVRNKGNVASDSFNVYLYWTLGGFYEKWPVSWHYDLTNNGFYNPNYGMTYPMGSEIGIAGISSLNANSSTTVTFEWDPPFPGWYDTSTYYDSERVVHPLCLLSRIVTCETSPYGMTIPEIEPTGDNVINNNNIVTRNTEVSDSIAFNKKTPVYVLRMGNQVSTPRKIRLVADNALVNYWDLGYYTLRLSENIMTAWQESGGQGSGFTLDDGVFIINDDGFYLDNIDLAGDEWGWAYFQFKLHPLVTITVDRGEQLFRFVQFSGDSAAPVYLPDGGFNFLLNFKPDVDDIPDIPEDFTIQDPKGKNEANVEQSGAKVYWHQETGGNNESKQPIEQKPTVTSVIAYPNPSSNVVFFGLSLESERTVEIELYNSLGALVGKIPSKNYSSGKHEVSYDFGRLSPGSYLAKVNVNGEAKIISLIIVR